MQLLFKTGRLTAPGAGTALFLSEDETDLTSRPELAAFQAAVAPLLAAGQFKAKRGDTLPLQFDQGWLFLVGLGKPAKITAETWLASAARAAQMAQDRQVAELEIILPPSDDPALTLKLQVMGSLLAQYRPQEYKSRPDPAPTLTRLIFRAEKLENGEELLEQARLMAEAVLLARRLGDRTANLLYPETFALEAAALAKPLGLDVEIFGEKELARERLNLILAVGGGSARPPRLVRVTYPGGPAGEKPVVLVGKGITFDSGGVSLKPSGSLEGMKTDMAGAAAVLAVTLAAARLKLPLNLTAIMPLAENMPDGAGCRVGDVYATRSGQTVEITNTDAEGRLILAEALTLAGELQPAAIIDVATLTGACAVALGERCAGLFCGQPDLALGLTTAAGQMAENVWGLPLLEDYEDLLKSEIADLVNAPGVPRGGAINAALFLRKFVAEGTPWAHLDIAGPGRAAKARPGVTVGATGFGVRTILHYLAERSRG